MTAGAGRLPKKVLHLMNSASGGAALSTLGLIHRLRALGVEACVVCDDAGSPEERGVVRAAVNGEAIFTPLYWWNRKIRAKAWKRPALEVRQLLRSGFRFGALARIAHAARTFGADLIHTNTILTPEGGRAARLLGLGHVWHLRELIGPDQPFQLPLEGAALGRYLLSHCSMLIANSAASAAAVTSLLPARAPRRHLQRHRRRPLCDPRRDGGARRWWSAWSRASRRARRSTICSSRRQRPRRAPSTESMVTCPSREQMRMPTICARSAPVPECA